MPRFSDVPEAVHTHPSSCNLYTCGTGRKLKKCPKIVKKNEICSSKCYITVIDKTVVRNAQAQGLVFLLPFMSIREIDI